jgi:2-polyprenyl-3-methyl-5-hydroxy-6-metoxy-1,4-benzoquinol methylase
MSTAETFTDKEGYETLASISQAPAFNRWMYDVVKKYCNGNILEIGSGIGNISQCFIDDKKKITISDYNPEYFFYLQKTFNENKFVENILQIDLVHQNFSEAYEEHLNRYNCVVTMNVVEHVQYDVLALHNISKLLIDGGTLVMLVPANKFLFNSLDKALGHYRRYNRRMILSLFEQTGFAKQQIKYFNAAAMPGWFAAGNIFKNTSVHAGQMKLYNALVPVFRLADACLLNATGISVIGVGTKMKK